MSPIVVDTSALVAIFKSERDAPALKQALGEASRAVLPASCLVEAALLRSVGSGFLAWVEQMIAEGQLEIGEISTPVATMAAKAARTFGKGSGHKAHLNFGDCLSYAVAEYRDLPLLYTGDDFAQTPIRSAIPNNRK